MIKHKVVRLARIARRETDGKVTITDNYGELEALLDGGWEMIDRITPSVTVTGNQGGWTPSTCVAAFIILRKDVEIPDPQQSRKLEI